MKMKSRRPPNAWRAPCPLFIRAVGVVEMMQFLDYTDFLSGVLDRVKKSKDEKLRKRIAVKRKASIFSESPPSDVVYGDIALRKLEEMLDCFPGYPRSETQKRFHRAFTGALLPHIYGDEFERHRTRVLESYGLKKVDYEVSVGHSENQNSSVLNLVYLNSVMTCPLGCRS